MTRDLEQQQRALCARYNAPYVAAPAHLRVGVARNVREGLAPLNGLRHSPVGSTTGWYLWAGEDMSEADDFFEPLCVEHLIGWCPAALPFLGLPPGWRFLTDGAYVDVWERPTLLDGIRRGDLPRNGERPPRGAAVARLSD